QGRRRVRPTLTGSAAELCFPTPPPTRRGGCRGDEDDDQGRCGRLLGREGRIDEETGGGADGPPPRLGRQGGQEARLRGPGARKVGPASPEGAHGAQPANRRGDPDRGEARGPVPRGEGHEGRDPRREEVESAMIRPRVVAILGLLAAPFCAEAQPKARANLPGRRG